MEDNAQRRVCSLILMPGIHLSILPEKRSYFLLHYPAERFCYLFLHCRGGGSDHPAVLRAVAYSLLYLDRAGTVPDLLERLLIEIPHTGLRRSLIQPVAGADLSEGIEEEHILPRAAGKKPGIALNVINQAMVEVSAKPVLRFIRLE